MCITLFHIEKRSDCTFFCCESQLWFVEPFISDTKQLYRILLQRGYDDDQLKKKFRDLK